MTNNNKIIGGEVHSDAESDQRAAFDEYKRTHPMATYWSTWLAGIEYQRNHDLSDAYKALANENDRLRRLLSARGIEHQAGAEKFQYRQRPVWRKDEPHAWMEWRACNKDVAEFYTENPEDSDWQYEVRGLYPYAAAPVIYPTPADVMKVVLAYQFEERSNVTGTSNWAANIGMAVVNRVKELNQ